MNKGLMVSEVAPASPAYRAGMQPGDRIVAVSGEPVHDELELQYCTAQPCVSLLFFRRNTLHEEYVFRRPGETFGLTVRRPPIKKCANRCLFCFVDQMPKGLRASLYVKDEDYRYSFTNGNYITLSRASAADMARIVQLGLTPLYVSVHATDQTVRKKLLGIDAAAPIMQQLRFLAKNNIAFHTQIVVCPGINDAAILTKSITDLLSLGSSLLSIAVVPVGLTRFHANNLIAMSADAALAVCREVGRLSDARVKTDRVRRVFCADELFVKAALPIPPKNYYEDYPQIENGVGLIRQLLGEWRSVKKEMIGAKSAKKHRIRPAVYAVITGVSAAPYLEKIMRDMESLLTGVSIRVVVVPNFFFGQSVTVAGLLTAADVVRAMGTNGAYRRVFMPRVMFNDGGCTLDGYSAARIARRIKASVTIVSNLSEVIQNVY